MSAWRLTIVGRLLGGRIHPGVALWRTPTCCPTWLLGWFIAFEILACMLYGSIFIAVGAACTEIKEAQSLLTPVMILVVILPLMVWFNVVQEPLASFAEWTSLFPPATPMLMLLANGGLADGALVAAACWESPLCWQR